MDTKLKCAVLNHFKKDPALLFILFEESKIKNEETDIVEIMEMTCPFISFS